MRICFICPPIEFYSPSSGGAIATIIMQTARVLLSRGHTVTVLAPAGEDAVYDVADVVPIVVPQRDDLSFLRRRIAGMSRRLHRWDWSYYGHYRAAFMRAVRELSEPPDAVLVFNDLVSARYLRGLLPHAAIAVWLQNEQRTNQSISQLRESIAAADVFLTCSQYIKDWTCQAYAIEPTRVIVARSGVDLNSFRPPDDFPRRGEVLRAIFVGRIDPNKGPDLAADAVAAVRREGLAVQLTVVGGLWFYGDGDPMRDPFFRQLKTKMDLSGARYAGHVPRDQLPDLIRGHDVAFALSRSNEPFGLVALETMASGCALISSNRGGLPEACDGAAALVDPDDFEAVVRALRELAQDGAALVDAKTRAADRARRAPWSNCAGIVERALAAVMSRRAVADAELEVI
jgi:glycosyltransferase involved in cell wall biosynthesis